MTATLEEHLGYLSDAGKLAAFRQVVQRAVRPGDLVADLGCGSGILGLLCLRAGAAKVWGIDRTEAIEIARETMHRAGLADRYICLRESSFRATLPEPVDLIVSDHVGFFGIDYGIIGMMDDARRRLLRPGGRIVPERIDVVLALAGSPDLKAKAEAWAGPNVPAEYRWLRDYGVDTKHPHDFRCDEICSEPATIASIDLAAEHPDLLRFSATLIASRPGNVDGLAGWFDCDLDQEIRMTNSPLADRRIDRQQVFLPFGERIAVVAGDAIEVALSLRHEDGVIAWSASHPRSGHKVRHSTWHSRLLSPADLHRTPGRPVELSPLARARQIVAGYVDGVRTADEIERAVLLEHAGLFPSRAEIARFVRDELQWSSQA